MLRTCRELVAKLWVVMRRAAAKRTLNSFELAQRLGNQLLVCPFTPFQ